MSLAAQGVRHLKVLYIVGSQNCGSTLLDAVLGNAPGVRSLGEAGGFYRYEAGRPCDCRRPKESCGPCRSTMAALAEEDDLDSFRRLATVPLRERRLHWLYLATRPRGEYARVADRVLATVADQSRRSILVDSSKNISRAASLVHDSGADVYVLHLVRDGRGQLRSRRFRAEAERRSPPPDRAPVRYRAPLIMATWLAKNLLISHLLRRRVPDDRFLMCRYEDLVTDPARELGRIGAFVGIDTAGLAQAWLGPGVARHHLFEPLRRADYRSVRLDRSRLQAQRTPSAENLRYWLCGGFLSSQWGYDHRQSYLDHVGEVSAG